MLFGKRIDTDRDYKRELDKATRYAKEVRQREVIRAVKHSNDRPRKELTFSKKIFIFIAINLVVIEIYAMWAMAHFRDFSALYALIGLGTPIVGIVASFCSYNSKSVQENSSGGLIYDMAMKQFEKNPTNALDDDDAVG